MSELLILYNASGSLLGHVSYGYHHIAKTPGKDCSACLLTHGPSLSISENKAWTDVKNAIERGEVGKGDIKVKQLHTEEFDQQTQEFLKSNNLALPCVLLRKEGDLSKVFDKSEMDGFNGDHDKFKQALDVKLKQM